MVLGREIPERPVAHSVCSLVLPESSPQGPSLRPGRKRGGRGLVFSLWTLHEAVLPGISGPISAAGSPQESLASPWSQARGAVMTDGQHPETLNGMQFCF